jgi:hypothetical protein
MLIANHIRTLSVGTSLTAERGRPCWLLTKSFGGGYTEGTERHCVKEDR